LLKTIVLAQADFRVNDRDGDGRKNYWRSDIAGLYVLPGPSGEPIGLILPSLAGADSVPTTNIHVHTSMGPSAGYWFKTLRFKNEDPARRDPDRFAACAYADVLTKGASVFVISHENLIWRRKARVAREALEFFPDAETLREEWERAD
jgi:hypothetical protein